MSVNPSLSYDSRSRRSAPPVRVFADVAPTPRIPAPRWWNHPVTFMFVSVICAALFFTAPALPVLSGLLAVVSGVALASLAEVARGRWAASRAHAVEESVWIADQCGYQVEAVGGVLHWRSEDRSMVARLERRGGGWQLSLLDVETPVLENHR